MLIHILTSHKNGWKLINKRYEIFSLPILNGMTRNTSVITTDVVTSYNQNHWVIELT